MSEIICKECGDRSCEQMGELCNGNDFGHDNVAQDN